MYLKLCFAVFLFAAVYARPSLLNGEQEDFRDPEDYINEVIDTGSEDPAPNPQRYRCPFGWVLRCKPNYTIGRWECKCYRRYGRDEPAVKGNNVNEDTERI